MTTEKPIVGFEEAWRRYTGDYLAHVEEAHTAEMRLALQRTALYEYERDLQRKEDRWELGTDPDIPGGKAIQGKNAEERAAHQRMLLDNDDGYQEYLRDARILREDIAKTLADLHRAERLYRLAKLQMESLSGYKGGDS